MRDERKRKVSLMEEFLSVLMRLWLGLVVEDVADRFQISVGTCSKVFHTWIRVTAQEMKVIFSMAVSRKGKSCNARTVCIIFEHMHNHSLYRILYSEAYTPAKSMRNILTLQTS